MRVSVSSYEALSSTKRHGENAEEQLLEEEDIVEIEEMFLEDMAFVEEELLVACDPAVLQEMHTKLDELGEKEKDIMRELEVFEHFYQGRRAPLDKKLEECQRQIKEQQNEILQEEHKANQEMPPAPGPPSFAFVQSECFGGICNLVVAFNLACMCYAADIPKTAAFFADQGCLTWYVFELTSKCIYHRRNLFCGRINIVWWNWMDTIIVVSGVLDQWLMPILKFCSGLDTQEGGSGINLKALRALRLLRLFRLLRVLKILRSLVESDLSWASSPKFETFMASVIAVNSVVMGLELDSESPYWVYIENAFLIVYTFELLVGIRRFGSDYFTHKEMRVWHWLDFSIVSGGVVDLWVMPLVEAIMSMTGHPLQTRGGSFSGVMKLIRMMRLLRVLRLVKLFRKIPPLYRLLIGVVEALDAMKWVMVLTALVLYACAVVFCTLVSQGVLYPKDDIPDNAKAHFGSMGKSLFSLFDLMNGDTTVVYGITDKLAGQILFAAFMVISNWSILAILTSVVSDNMITASGRILDDEAAKSKAEKKRLNREKMLSAFKEIDADGGGTITNAEWQILWNDDGIRNVLQEATNLEAQDLMDLYVLVCKMQHDENLLPYDDFVSVIEDDGKPMDRRSFLKLMARMENLEKLMEKHFDDEGEKIESMMSMERSLTKQLSGSGEPDRLGQPASSTREASGTRSPKKESVWL
jgi:hypothetical protein